MRYQARLPAQARQKLEATQTCLCVTVEIFSENPPAFVWKLWRMSLSLSPEGTGLTVATVAFWSRSGASGPLTDGGLLSL